MVFYNLSVKESLTKLESSSKGITLKEASARRRKYGPNTIKVSSTPLWRKILAPFLDIFTLVLAVAAVISLLTGAVLDSIIILVIIGISATIYYIQTFSTEKVLRSLSKHDAQKVSVLRGGREMLIDSSQLVPGDVVMLSEGEKVPADIRIIDEANLTVDESQLTGESLPIEKQLEKLKDDRRIYEQTNMLFQGSFVISGTCQGLVTATGNNTEFGNLAVLSKKDDERSPVQKKIDNLISKIIAIVSALSIVTFGLALLRGMELLESLRFVMALAVSAVPESLPIAISVILVLGMRRMAKKKALVHQMRAIETIGVITTIATDKTGTLTKNQLSVREAWSPGNQDSLNNVVAHVINSGNSKSHDPLDRALASYVRRQKISIHGSPAEELPFDQEVSMSANVWHYGTDYRIYLKGAPEAIIKSAKLDKKDLKKAKKALAEFTTAGYRVIGLASLRTESQVEEFSDIKGQKLKFEGLIAVADSLRPEASKAIKSALAAGVSVRMITGDHFETAYQIGSQLGLAQSREEVFDCSKMDDMTDRELGKIVESAKVFSRVIPAQKHRLLNILKKHNITAMTGDGVNDVPALSNAHVGIAMGSGSQITKDAGAIVLLDDNFKTIIDAMKEGRIIIANIRRMLFYLLSTNTGELVIMISALIIGIKTPLEPVQILWVNLVTDTSMVIPLGLEPAEKSVMKQPPRKPNAPILDKFMITRMIIIALTMTIITLVVYIFFENNYGHAYAQTLAFLALVVTQWANAFNARSDYESVFTRLKVPNRSFYVGMFVSVFIQVLVFTTPLGEFLHLTSVSAWHITIVSLISFTLPILASEIHKWRRRVLL